MPTQAELQQLFVDATSSPAFAPNDGFITNTEMCSKYGWPLSGQCGGSAYYWSSTLDSTGSHYYVTLNNGAATSRTNDSANSLAACIR
ncbi:hypothetical protein D3C76_1314960 [compost metagenome]